VLKFIEDRFGLTNLTGHPAIALREE